MRTPTAQVLALCLIFLSSCTPTHPPPTTQPTALLLIIPGAGGDGPWRQSLVSGLRRGGVTAAIEVFPWGAPTPLFMLNLQTPSIHRDAERALASRIRDASRRYPTLRIVAHSAGCGVALGALSQLDQATVSQTLLLAPSVSPTYDLVPALRHTARLDVFHSPRDTFWLSWRTGTFGTYDNVKTKAAGNTGFTSRDPLPADLAPRLHQHPYDATWSDLGNDGGHFGPTEKPFAEKVLAPLLCNPVAATTPRGTP